MSPKHKKIITRFILFVFWILAITSTYPSSLANARSNCACTPTACDCGKSHPCNSEKRSGKTSKLISAGCQNSKPLIETNLNLDIKLPTNYNLIINEISANLKVAEISAPYTSYTEPPFKPPRLS